MHHEISFIGAGNMAEAMARAALSKGSDPANMMGADVSPERRAYFERELKIKCVAPDDRSVADAAIIVLSVKPQHMAAALQTLAANISDWSTIISIAAGISTSFIDQHLPPATGGGRWRIVRAMPNTPMLVGEGMVAIARGANATPLEMNAARDLFESAAEVIEVPEEMIDAVTAVSGSGPAYFFFLVEQMIAAATQLGLSDEHARKLAIKTAAGAAKMLATSADDPKELRRKVTSPGGTTEAAINHMTNQHWPQITIDAIKAAEKRGKELGK